MAGYEASDIRGRQTHFFIKVGTKKQFDVTSSDSSMSGNHNYHNGKVLH